MKTITYNPETHVLVPREPTEKMCDAATADSCWENMNPPPSTAYRLMIAAAPQPEPVESEPVGWYDGETGWLGKRKGGEHWQPVFTHQPADNKQVDVEPVGYVDYGDRVEWYKKPVPETDLYTTPQPDRVSELEAETTKLKLDLLTSYGEAEELSGKVAELEAALKVARDELYGKTELLKSIRDVIEEAQTYCEGPQWSPSMADECKAALAKINEVLHD